MIKCRFIKQNDGRIPAFVIRVAGRALIGSGVVVLAVKSAFICDVGADVFVVLRLVCDLNGDGIKLTYSSTLTELYTSVHVECVPYPGGSFSIDTPDYSEQVPTAQGWNQQAVSNAACR